MKNFLKFGLGFLSVAMLAMACSDGKEDPQVDLKLSSDKESIAPDGTDAVTFTVKNGGTDVTASAKIYNQTDKVYLESNKFTSKTEGTYTFIAEYDNAKSNVVTITVGGGSSAIVLTVDKNEIEATGTDAATFTVTYNGEDVTAKAQVFNKTNSTPLELTDGVFKFSTTTAGAYEFEATYEEHTSAIVTVTAADRGPFDANKKLYRMALVTKVTGTWCPYCPNATTAIEQVEGILPNRMVEIAIHGGDSYEARPFANNFISHFKITGYPTVMVDLDPNRQTISTASAIKRFVEKSVNDYPTIVGIAVDSKVEGNKATVSVTLGTRETREVKLVVALVEDGIIGPQANGGSNYEHNRTLRTASSELYAGDNLGEITQGQEITKEYSFDLNSSWKVENLRVVAYAIAGVNVDGEIITFVNNAVYCPINGSVYYHYDE